MGNKLVPIIIAIVVIIGAVLGLGVAGIVPIPGLTKPKPAKSKAEKKAEAKKQDQAKADAEKADIAAKQQAADALQKLVADRDQLVKDGKWQEAAPLAQQAVDELTKDKAPAEQLDAATAVLTRAKSEAEKAAAPKPDLDKGYAKLAAVWGEMEPDKVVDILVPAYKPEAAAPILKLMDDDKVAAVLASAKLNPKQAAAYSEALAKEASKPPPTPVGAG